MSVELREARQPWILLSPSLLAVTLLLFIPLLFIFVHSFWLRTATGTDVTGLHFDNRHEALTDSFYRDILGSRNWLYGSAQRIRLAGMPVRHQGIMKKLLPCPLSTQPAPCPT